MSIETAVELMTTKLSTIIDALVWIGGTLMVLTVFKVLEIFGVYK